MFTIIIFLLGLLLIIGLGYSTVKTHKNTGKVSPLIIGLYLITLFITIIWLYYGFLFLAIIMKGV